MTHVSHASHRRARCEQNMTHVSNASRRAGRARRIFWRVRGGLWRVYLPRLPIPVMAPKRSASTSPEPSTSWCRSGWKYARCRGEAAAAPPGVCTTESGTLGLPSGWPNPSHRTTASAVPASRPFSTAAPRQPLLSGLPVPGRRMRSRWVLRCEPPPWYSRQPAARRAARRTKT
jgi:hypothetical protein